MNRTALTLFLLFLASWMPLARVSAQEADLESFEWLLGESFSDQNLIQFDFPDSYFGQESAKPFGNSGKIAFELKSNIVSDFKKFYNRGNAPLLLSVFAIGAASANTPFDESIREILHENIVDTGTDDYAEFLHENGKMGDGYLVLPAYAALALIGKGLSDYPAAELVGEWSERNIRAMLVGAPALILFQNLTGGSRPNETSYRSDWRPFQDDNGVSGHAFMGAIPFLTAANMTENRWAKSSLFLVSVVPGLSRITDERHYPSQVLLGWSLAYMATKSVGQTELQKHSIEVSPAIFEDSAGIGITIRR